MFLFLWYMVLISAFHQIRPFTSTLGTCWIVLPSPFVVGWGLVIVHGLRHPQTGHLIANL